MRRSKSRIINERDFALLKHLTREPLASFERLGELVGISGNSARLRYESLVRTGTLTGVEALLAGDPLGKQICCLKLKSVESQQSLVPAHKHPDVFFSCHFIDGTATILAYSDPENLLPLRHFANQLGLSVESCGPAPFPPWPQPMRRTLTTREIRFLAALAAEPRQPIRDLAAAADCSPRTAVQLRTSLVAEGYALIGPLINYGRSARLSCFTLLIHGEQTAIDRLVAENPHLAALMPSHAPECTVLIGHASSTAHALDELARVRGLIGIRSVEIRFRSDHLYERNKVSRLFHELAQDDSPRRLAVREDSQLDASRTGALGERSRLS